MAIASHKGQEKKRNLIPVNTTKLIFIIFFPPKNKKKEEMGSSVFRDEAEKLDVDTTSISYKHFKLVTLKWPQSQYTIQGIVKKTKWKRLLRLNYPYEWKGERVPLNQLFVKDETLWQKDASSFTFIQWETYIPALSQEEKTNREKETTILLDESIDAFSQLSPASRADIGRMVLQNMDRSLSSK